MTLNHVKTVILRHFTLKR